MSCQSCSCACLPGSNACVGYGLWCCSFTQVLDELASLGFSRVTFVGGEPLLHPNTDRLIHETKARGMDTCLVGCTETHAHTLLHTQTHTDTHTRTWIACWGYMEGVCCVLCVCAQVTNGSLLTVARLRALAREFARETHACDAYAYSLGTDQSNANRPEACQCLYVRKCLCVCVCVSVLAASLDILAFSVDASSDALNALLGRGLRHEITQVWLCGDNNTQITTHIPRHLGSLVPSYPLGARHKERQTTHKCVDASMRKTSNAVSMVRVLLCCV